MQDVTDVTEMDHPDSCNSCQMGPIKVDIMKQYVTGPVNIVSIPRPGSQTGSSSNQSFAGTVQPLQADLETDKSAFSSQEVT